MNQRAVKLQERCELYRKFSWQCFDPNAVAYTDDQVRSERALHGRQRTCWNWMFVKAATS